MLQDIRFALRSLAKSPGFVFIVILTLALGIGVNTSMYTLVDVLFYRTVPFPEAEQLLSVIGTSPRSQRENFSFKELEEVREQAVGPGKAFESLTTYAYWNNTLVEPGRPSERLLSIDATEEFFRTFKVQPTLGRGFTPEEQIRGKNQVAILMHHIWLSRFGGDPEVIGRTVRLNAEQVTIVGVMPASFSAPLFFGPIDLLRPMTVPPHIVDDRSNRFFNALARLNPGVTPEQALAQLRPLAANWAKDYPQTSTDRGFKLMPPHKAAMDSTSEFITWLLFGLGLAILLVACANIANLQLARATSNIKELAIRSALGATRRQLVVHQLTGSMVLALAGGACGVLVGLWVNAIFGHAIRLGGEVGQTLDLPMNGRVLLMTFGASVGTGLLFGLLPAWFASRGDLVTTLKQQSRGSTSGRGQRFMRNSLIVAEVAVAVALLSVASIMIRGLDAMMHKENGWDTEKLIAANIHLPEQSTYNTEEKRRLAIERLNRLLEQLPGAEHTALSTSAPLFGYSRTAPLQVEGQTSDDPNRMPSAGYTHIWGDYFQTLGVPLLEGRYFPPEMKPDHPPLAIINQTMAAHFWPNESAVGKRFGERQGDRTIWREVVGVVGDVQFAINIANPTTMFQVYKPMVQEPWGYMFLLARGPTPANFKNDLRRIVSDLDPDVAVLDMFTVPEAADRFQHNLYVINNTLMAFALLGLILAAVGIYGVISYLVAQRTGEFGIRLALGATRGDVLRLVLRHGATLTAIGLGIGLVAALGLARLLATSMPRIAGFDPIAILGTAFALLAVGLFACWVPARRATRVDPMVVLWAD